MEDPYKREGALLRRTRELMAETDMRVLDIYKATGVTPNQQLAIKSGKTKAPSVNSVEAIYNVLSGRPLEL